MKVSELKDKATVEELELTVTEVKEPRETRFGMVQSTIAKDDSGTVTLTLWNDQVGQYNVGDAVKLTKGWCKEYMGELQVSSGKYGTLEKVGGQEQEEADSEA